MVLTQPFDPTADLVIESLYEREVEVVRFDTGWFPRDAILVAGHEVGRPGIEVAITPVRGRVVDLSRIASVWYRRPRDFAFDDQLDPESLKFARAEALHAIGGVLRGTRCRWMNHPEKMISANYKPYQLMLAPRMGLSIPRTLITNDPKKAKIFIEENKQGSIYKTLSSPEVTSDTYEHTTIFTSKVSQDDLVWLSTVRYTPCLLQEFVLKAYEIRVTIIGDNVFTAALRAPVADVVDWRPMTDQMEYSAHTLPDEVSRACLRLTRRLGLSFAALDLVVTPDDRYVFLEVNPAGQWAWLEPPTGLRMTEALTDWLAPFTVHRTSVSYGQ